MKKLLLATVLIGAASLTTWAEAKSPIRGNVRIVIGSRSTGGDTYQNSAIIANELSEKTGANFKVDAVGASAGFKALSRAKGNNTVMIFHDGAYLMNLYGVEGIPNIFDEYIIGPTIAVNPGEGYFVPKSSPYNTVEDVIEAAGNGEKVRVAIQPGSVSEIGYSAIKNAVKIKYPGQEVNLVPFNTGSTADKNQALFDSQVDLIAASLQADEQYTRLPADDQKAMKLVWLLAREDMMSEVPEAGLGETTREELLKFVEPNVIVDRGDGQNFTFDKEFFFLYNKDMDPEVIKYLDDTLTEIYAEGKIQEIQKKSFFIPDFLPSTEAQDHLREKREVYKKIIDSIK